uniref:Uncharacterized protein n=1 Tax=Magallana gigas TaxID=29159 RepID=K1R6A0_MAGGI
MKELAAIGLGGINLEKPVGGGLITDVLDKKDMSDSDLKRAMELGKSWFVMVSNSPSTNPIGKYRKCYMSIKKQKTV